MFWSYSSLLPVRLTSFINIHTHFTIHLQLSIFFLIMSLITHQMQFVLPVYSWMRNHPWEYGRSTWGHNLKENSPSQIQKALTVNSSYFLFVCLFISPDFIPPSRSTLQLFHNPYLLPTSFSPRGCPQSHPHPTRLLNPPGPPVSWGLGAFSITEPRPVSPLVYMCWEPHISWCMLPG